MVHFIQGVHYSTHDYSSRPLVLGSRAEVTYFHVFQAVFRVASC